MDVRPSGVRLRVVAGPHEQSVELVEHGAVMRVGLLAHQTAHRLVGYADLPAHVLDALVDAFEFGAYLGEQDAGLALEIRVLAMSRTASSISRRPSSVTITWNASSKRRPLSDSWNDLWYSSW